ncbi:MAG: hypothetical protein ACI8T1_003699 [Verrucomicrobiales bacterium]|jgi:hypothetical protein
MLEDESGAPKFSQMVWDELLCFMTVRAERHELAEPLVQDVLVRAARQPELLTDPLRFRVWLYRVQARPKQRRRGHSNDSGRDRASRGSIKACRVQTESEPSRSLF